MRKRLPVPTTLFGGIVLVILMLLLAGTVTKNQNALFDQGSAVTLYCETTLGVEPEFPVESYFPKDQEGYKELDYTKLAFDMEQCNLNASGVYEIPVYYDGKRTVCTVELTVLGLPASQEILDFEQKIYGQEE